MTKKDFFTAGILMFFASLVLFLGLGSANMPQTVWQASEGDKIEIELSEGVKLSDIALFLGESEDGILFVGLYNSNGNMITNIEFKTADCLPFVWSSSSEKMLDVEVESLKISAEFGTISIHEIVLLDEDGDRVDFSDAVFLVESGHPTEYARAFDEQHTYFPNSIQHEMAREERGTQNTSFGSTLQGLGVRIFGNNPLGWRFISALMSLLTVPLLYFMGKKLFASSWFAAIFTGIASFDGVRLALSRVGTADAAALFFLLLACYFVLCFYKTNIKAPNAHKKSLLRLGFASGAFFLAVSVTTVNLLIGAGLVAILAVALLRDKESLCKNGWMAQSLAGVVLFALSGVVGAFIFPLSGRAVDRLPLKLEFSVMYWVGLFALIFALLSLLTSRFDTSGESRKKNRTSIFLLACAVGAYLPMIFIPWFSFSYHYFIAAVFLAGFTTLAMRELAFVSGTKFALGRWEVPKGAIACGVAVLLIVMYFILTLPFVGGLPWIV